MDIPVGRAQLRNSQIKPQKSGLMDNQWFRGDGRNNYRQTIEDIEVYSRPCGYVEQSQ